mmetsp:Transcript_860/g.3169  ORF Transcript_860/g.3169 Transcript_860/m.3169 type:complete len:232 (-) Transcript_860:1116-1811(-)
MVGGSRSFSISEPSEHINSRTRALWNLLDAKSLRKKIVDLYFSFTFRSPDLSFLRTDDTIYVILKFAPFLRLTNLATLGIKKKGRLTSSEVLSVRKISITMRFTSSLSISRTGVKLYTAAVLCAIKLTETFMPSGNTASRKKLTCAGRSSPSLVVIMSKLACSSSNFFICASVGLHANWMVPKSSRQPNSCIKRKIRYGLEYFPSKLLLSSAFKRCTTNLDDESCFVFSAA